MIRLHLQHTLLVKLNTHNIFVALLTLTNADSVLLKQKPFLIETTGPRVVIEGARVLWPSPSGLPTTSLFDHREFSKPRLFHSNCTLTVGEYDSQRCVHPGKLHSLARHAAGSVPLRFKTAILGRDVVVTVSSTNSSLAFRIESQVISQLHLGWAKHVEIQ